MAEHEARIKSRGARSLWLYLLTGEQAGQSVASDHMFPIGSPSMTNFKPKALVFFFVLLQCSEEITMDLFSESFEYDDDEKTERPIVGR